MYDLNAIDDAVENRLKQDAGVIAAAPGGVHYAEAPDGTPVPHLIIQAVSDVPQHTLRGGSTLDTLSYLVRAIAYGNEARHAAGTLLQAAHNALTATPLPVPGYAVLALKREGSGQRYVDSDGFWNYAAYFRLILNS